MDKSLSDALTAWRRHLHANPELTLYETNTAAFVCARLAELGVPFVAGIGGHGVVATISRGQSNRSVGLRADMDALPILEQNEAPYCSQNAGVPTAASMRAVDSTASASRPSQSSMTESGRRTARARATASRAAAGSGGE